MPEFAQKGQGFAQAVGLSGSLAGGVLEFFEFFGSLRWWKKGD
jgi:hypothetical protein